jgi:hypothetical protein
MLDKIMAFHSGHKALYVPVIAFLFWLSFSPAFGGKIYIQEGKQIGIKFKADISTESDQEPKFGDIAEVASSDTIAGIVVFQPGCKVFGDIKLKKPGHLGRPGSLRVQIDSVQTIQGKMIAIKQPLVLSLTGKSNKKKALLMLPLLGYGYLIKGDHAILQEKDKIIPAKTARLGEINF